MKFESKIAAFLDTHLLFAWNVLTKQLIGCKWVIETVDYIRAIWNYFTKYKNRSNNLTCL